MFKMQAGKATHGQPCPHYLPAARELNQQVVILTTPAHVSGAIAADLFE